MLPLVVLVWGAVWLHESYGWWSWLALAGGIFASALVLLIYAVVARGYVTGRIGDFRTLKRSYWVALILVVVYCLPVVSYLSASNAKYEEVRQEFTRLHPILRIGISTLLL